MFAGMPHQQQQQAQQMQQQQMQQQYQQQQQMHSNQHMHMPAAHQMHQQPGPRMQQNVPLRQEQGMHCMSGMQVSQPNMNGSQHPMSGMQNMQTIASTVNMQQPQQSQFELVAVPIGTIPPQGAILASAQTITATTPETFTTSPDQFIPMSEIFQPNLCVPATRGKFRIINPKTGEEVQGHEDKNSKRFRIVNPGTGREVFGGDEASDVENHEPGMHFESRYYGNSEAVGGDAYDTPAGSWDWPLSRREIQDRLERIP